MSRDFTQVDLEPIAEMILDAINSQGGGALFFDPGIPGIPKTVVQITIPEDYSPAERSVYWLELHRAVAGVSKNLMSNRVKSAELVFAHPVKFQ